MQTHPRLLAAASAATQKPPSSPLHVQGGDTALLTQSVANFVNFDGVKIYKFDFKFEHKNDKAKYREMDLRVAT